MEKDNKAAALDDEKRSGGKHDPFSPYYGEEEDKKDPKKQSFAASIYDIAEMFALCAAVVLIIFTFFARLTVVDGQSMEKTLHDQEFILVRSIGYEPKRGDIVVFNIPNFGGRDDKPLIKRVIAVGGDTLDIDFDTWTVTVNGEVVDESAYFDNATKATLRAGYELPKVIEDGHIFVMGDNRNNSHDSRQPDIGQVDVRCVVGKAAVRLFPLKQFTVFGDPYEQAGN